MSSYERSGWRDKALSERHRLYGTNVPAVDLDFVEYDRGAPRAIIEYKEVHAMPFLGTPNIAVLQRLSDRADLPFFVSRYDHRDWVYEVFPCNSEARIHFTGPVLMSEQEYVSFLHSLRGREAPPDLLKRLNGNLPMEAWRWT